MQKFLPLILLAVAICFTGGLYFLHQYWIHRYDSIIEQQAAIYRLDPRLVWSIIHEETYFRPWTTGDAGEVGLMQITPTVAREWASETGIQEFEEQASNNTAALLRDAERNIQIGCWYLEKLFERYRDAPAEGRAARVLAGYNAGASRVTEWEKSADRNAPLSEEEFIRRIDIASTRAYVTNILRRYRYLKNGQAR